MSSVCQENSTNLQSEDYLRRIENENTEYNEIDDIPLIPLYALMAVDDENVTIHSEPEELMPKVKNNVVKEL